jgi:Tripartite tricarboxylate transporter family receptor
MSRFIRNALAVVASATSLAASLPSLPMPRTPIRTSRSRLSCRSQHIKAGKTRPLAVTTAKRSSALPDVPTLAESGLTVLSFS